MTFAKFEIFIRFTSQFWAKIFTERYSKWRIHPVWLKKKKKKITRIRFLSLGLLSEVFPSKPLKEYPILFSDHLYFKSYFRLFPFYFLSLRTCALLNYNCDTVAWYNLRCNASPLLRDKTKIGQRAVNIGAPDTHRGVWSPRTRSARSVTCSCCRLRYTRGMAWNWPRGLRA